MADEIEIATQTSTPEGGDTGQKTSKGILSDIKVDDVSKDTELNQHEEVNTMPSAEQEEQVIKKKYGGIVPKKPPLISKDHERAFFDSADWALGKQGGHAQKPKGPLEALRPKLQPTPQQQVRSRRPVYASSETEDGDNAAYEGANDNNDGTDGSDQ